MCKYPSKVMPLSFVEFLKNNTAGNSLSDAVWIGGRIVGILEDGFVLQDYSGRLDVVWEGKVQIGDIVQVNVLKVRVVQGEGRCKLIGFPKSDGTDAGRDGDVAHENFDGEESFCYKGLELEVLTPCLSEFFVSSTSPNYKKALVDLHFHERLVMRSQIIKEIRRFFDELGFMEVDTPAMVKLPGMEPYLDVFKTKFRCEEFDGKGLREEDMFLVTSPEYAMKKLLVAGFNKVYQICKSFRNKETFSETHNPEFTMIEWYRAYDNYYSIMEDTECLVEALALKFNGKPVIEYKGHSVDVSVPWTRYRVKDLFKDFCGISYDVFEDVEAFRSAVAARGYKVSAETSFDDLFFLLFMNEIEPKLGFDKPVIVCEYPVSMASLSKRLDDDSRYAQRFEAYVAGVELCNAFTELNDPKEQESRLSLEREERASLGKDLYDVDGSFIEALKFGLPPSGGTALGVDRLVMLLSGAADINDVLWFPYRDL